MPKLSFLRLAIALCLIVSLIMFLMAMPKANAESRGVVFYGSRWGMTSDEIDAAREVINYVKEGFKDRGYTCYDLYGSQTKKQTVLDYASAMEETFDHVAGFHHGHAGKMVLDNVLHWDYFDDNGPDYSDDLIWDYAIYPKTRGNKHFFVMLWACFQGDPEGYPGYIDYKGRAVGMPFSWLHPISRGDCFIGFKNASMP